MGHPLPPCPSPQAKVLAPMLTRPHNRLLLPRLQEEQNLCIPDCHLLKGNASVLVVMSSPFPARISFQRSCLSYILASISVSLSNLCARDKENTRKGLATPQPCQEAGLSVSGPDLAVLPPGGCKATPKVTAVAQKATPLGGIPEGEG